ncbi:MAG: hypothetical protein R3321_12440 [Nitrososphaeraceae archaeon]|nr:hypothetical protein [Nitrososphaeraceae archaeon]
MNDEKIINDTRKIINQANRFLRVAIEVKEYNEINNRNRKESFIYYVEQAKENLYQANENIKFLLGE